MMGKLSAAEIEVILNKQIVGRIGCHADGITYVVPISYAYDGNYLYGHTHEGMKLALMRKNTSVCFEVDEMINMANWKSVIVQGKFEELEDPQLRKHALDQLNNRVLPLISSVTTHLSPYWPFPPEDYKEIKGVVFRIAVIERSGRFENDQSNRP